MVDGYWVTLLMVLKQSMYEFQHHGSKYSSSAEFIRALSPKIAIIEVGKNNYGHPHPDAIKRIQTATDNILRTDQKGTIKIIKVQNKLKIYSQR